jgi:hypothetical protein
VIEVVGSADVLRCSRAHAGAQFVVPRE